MSGNRLGAAFVLAALAGPGPGAPGEPAIVPGEVIVAFRKGTEPEGIAARAAAGDPAGRERLEAYLAATCREVGIPARMKRLASGGDVLLAIDFAELTARLVSRLRDDPRVARATPMPGEKRGPPGPVEVRVDFKDGSKEVTDRVARDLGVPLSSRVTAEQQFLVAVDAEAGTRELVERLRRRPDVAYVQPNFVVRKLSRP